MVFIQIPAQLTEEEKMLQQKYQKLKRKKKALQQLKAPKPEPPPVQFPIKRPSDGGSKQDPKEVAKKLLKSGKISAIKAPDNRIREGQGFKRSKALERKRGIGVDKPGGYHPFASSHSLEEETPTANISAVPPPNVSEPTTPTTPTKPAAKSLYESFVSSRDPESIAREETNKEKRRDGKANYVNRDTPQQGNTIYVHGRGVTEAILRTGFSLYGNILNITAEPEKNCGFITFDSIDCANKAIDEVNGQQVSGIKLKVMLARRQPTLERSVSCPVAEPASTQASASTTSSWSTIAASYSQKGAYKDRRELVSYEEDEIFK